MSYFDDPKKKAAWEKELNALKQEKAALAGRPAATRNAPSAENSLDRAQETERSAMYESAPTRERISYAQLLIEENMAVQAKKTMAAERTLQKEVSFEM